MLEKPWGIPKNWEWTSLESIADINPKLPYEFSDDVDVSFIPMSNVEEETGYIDLSQIKKYGEVKKGYTKFIDGDIIFAKITPCMENGKVAVISGLKNGVGFGSTEFHVIRLKDNMLSERFYFHYLLQKWFRNLAKQNFTGTVGQRRVPTDFMKAALVPISPFNEQVRIVARIEELFSRLDTGVRSFQAAQTRLEQYRQTTLQQAYTGNLTKKWRQNGNKLKLIDASLKIPYNWEYVELEKITNKITDGEHIKPKYVQSGIPFITAKNVRENGVVFDDIAYISEKDAKKSRIRCNPEKGDILIVSRGATIGRGCIIDTDKIFTLLGSVILLKLKDTISQTYLNYILKSIEIQKKIINLSSSTAQQAIYLRDIKKLKIPLPPFDEQIEISKILEQKMSIIKYIDTQFNYCSNISSIFKQAILKKAFEGNLVPQDLDDESASILLERLKAQKIKNRRLM